MNPPDDIALDDLVCVRYLVHDVQAAIDFYTDQLGFTLRVPNLTRSARGTHV